MLLNKVVENEDVPVLEQVCFVYSKIEWKWDEDGVLASDEWEV